MMLITKTILKQIVLLSALIIFEAGAMAGNPVIIGFHHQPGNTEKQLIENLGGTVKYTYKLLPAIAAELPLESRATLLKDPSVRYITDDETVNAVDPTPSTTSKQLSIKPSITQDLISDDVEYKNSWGVERIGAKTAHENNITGNGIKIAILDTGINYYHEDLDANYRGGHNFIANGRESDDPFDDSYNQHGTNIAGIIAAESNGVGVIGVAPEASIYAVKVLDGGTFGSLSDIIAGIQWAVDNHMDIANISIAGIDSDLLKATCDAAEQAGLLIVAAAGNTYSGAAQYPAAFESVIAVAGTDTNDSKGFFSPIDAVLEIAAPGLNIYSTAQDNTYAPLSGTSQSAAFVSGAAALILSHGVEDLNHDGKTDNRDVRMKLHTSVTDLGDVGRDDKYGYGLLNLRDTFTTPESFSINLDKKSSWSNSIQEVELRQANYAVDMKNNALSAVVMLVYEEGQFRGNLTKFYFFQNNNDDISFHLDASNTTLNVFFIPLGTVSASAQITFTP